MFRLCSLTDCFKSNYLPIHLFFLFALFLLASYSRQNICSIKLYVSSVFVDQLLSSNYFLSRCRIYLFLLLSELSLCFCFLSSIFLLCFLFSNFLNYFTNCINCFFLETWFIKFSTLILIFNNITPCKAFSMLANTVAIIVEFNLSS